MAGPRLPTRQTFSTSSLGLTATVQDLKVDPSFTVGGRAGYWFDNLDWLDMGVDVFRFKAKAPNQTATIAFPGLPSVRCDTRLCDPSAAPGDWFSLPVIGFNLDVLKLRLPLMRSEEMPHGRLQSYITAGPAVFITWAKSDAVQPPISPTRMSHWA